MLEQRFLDSPLGTLRLVASNATLVAVYFPEHRHVPDFHAETVTRNNVLDAAAEELSEYFAGRRKAFSIPLGPRGTEFQQRVWAGLREIPFGETRTYRELAAGIDRPRAVRAVGSANARNPISIVVPCHRVIGANGSLVGYAGGVDRKRWLLEHERQTRKFASDERESYPTSS